MTNRQDMVLIALTRENGISRDAVNLSIETGIPRASIRRIIGELRLLGFCILRTVRGYRWTK